MVFTNCSYLRLFEKNAEKSRAACIHVPIWGHTLFTDFSGKENDYAWK